MFRISRKSVKNPKNPTSVEILTIRLGPNNISYTVYENIGLTAIYLRNYSQNYCNGIRIFFSLGIYAAIISRHLR